MNRKAVVSAVMAMIISSTGVAAFAKDKNDRDDRDDGGRKHYSKHKKDKKDHHENDGRGHDKNHGERGAGPNHNYYRGDRLPAEYRHRQYVVNDWRGHHLSAPPRGYQWVQTGGDYALVAVNSGIILQVFLN